MCKLEEFLRKHKLLYKYLKNIDLNYRASSLHINTLTIQHSFQWSNTEEGYDFWLNIHRETDEAIPIERIIELQREYKLIPPRYKEIL